MCWCNNLSCTFILKGVVLIQNDFVCLKISFVTSSICNCEIVSITPIVYNSVTKDIPTHRLSNKHFVLSSIGVHSLFRRFKNKHVPYNCVGTELSLMGAVKMSSISDQSKHKTRKSPLF